MSKLVLSTADIRWLKSADGPNAVFGEWDDPAGPWGRVGIGAVRLGSPTGIEWVSELTSCCRIGRSDALKIVAAVNQHHEGLAADMVASAERRLRSLSMQWTIQERRWR